MAEQTESRDVGRRVHGVGKGAQQSRGAAVEPLHAGDRGLQIGGIDVAGVVVESRSDRFSDGDEVLVTGCKQSQQRDGGYSEYLRLDSASVIPLPDGLDLREAMAIGTAGLTAMLSVLALEAHEPVPPHQEVARVPDEPARIDPDPGERGFNSLSLSATCRTCPNARTSGWTRMSW